LSKICEDAIPIEPRCRDAISVSEEIGRDIPICESFDNLLGGSDRRGMLGRTEVQHFAQAMRNHEEHK
jgi:hypothetical protein